MGLRCRPILSLLGCDGRRHTRGEYNRIGVMHMSEKSFVNITLKQSSAKGGGIGFEAQCQVVEGTSEAELGELRRKAQELAKEIFQADLAPGTTGRAPE